METLKKITITTQIRIKKRKYSIQTRKVEASVGGEEQSSYCQAEGHMRETLRNKKKLRTFIMYDLRLYSQSRSWAEEGAVKRSATALLSRSESEILHLRSLSFLLFLSYLTRPDPEAVLNRSCRDMNENNPRTKKLGTGTPYFGEKVIGVIAETVPIHSASQYNTAEIDNQFTLLLGLIRNATSKQNFQHILEILMFQKIIQ